MQAYFGIITGTNSVTIASEVGKIRPSLAWLGHPGCYELGAFALAAAATHEITRWQDARTGHKTTTVRFQPSHGGWRNGRLGRTDHGGGDPARRQSPGRPPTSCPVKCVQNQRAAMRERG